MSELKLQLRVSAEGHRLAESHSESIEQIQRQVQSITSVQRELERQACVVAGLKSQIRSCKSSWRMELSHQVSMTTYSLLRYILFLQAKHLANSCNH